MKKLIPAFLVAIFISTGALAGAFFLPQTYRTSGGSAPTNSSLPTVASSSPVVGTPETATTGSWTNSPTGYACQWERFDTSSNISGATSCSGYTPVTGDIGHTLAMTAVASNGHGSNSATSTATSAVVAAAPVVSNSSFSNTLPLTNGEAIGTMSATNSPTGWSLTACSPSCTAYFAISSGGAITVTSSGASSLTAQTYTATAQATNGGGSGSGTATIAIGAAPSAPANSAAPAVTSTSPIVGVAETTTNGTWSGSPTGYTYQWIWADSSANISGATAASYTPVSGDLTHTLKAAVTATNGAGSTSANSNTTSAVANPASPTNSVAPAVTSTSPLVGVAETTTNGTWTGSPTGYTYQWSRADTATNISGATSSSYTPVSGDATHTLKAAVTATNAGGSNTANSNTTSAVTTSSYVGLLDQYTGLSPTIGWSNHALKKSYADGGGEFAVIHRQSDATTTTVGFDTNYQANVSTYTAFGCADSNPCFIDTQYDQTGNGLDETCTNVRVFIAADGFLARSPQAGGKCVRAYSATFATANQEMLAVGAPTYLDNRGSQVTGVPHIQTTGTVTNNSASISAVSSIAGMSAANNQTGQPSSAGVYDSQGCLPQFASGAAGMTYVSAVSGSTITANYAPGNISATCTKTSDTLTYTNAVLGGVWWANGPTASGITGAYWAFGLSVNSIDGSAGQTTERKNGTTYSSNNGNGANPGQGMRGATAAWDIESQTGTIYYNGTLISTTLSSAAITYSTNVQLTKYQAPNATDQLINAVFEQEVLISSVQTGTNRTAIASWEQTQFGFTPFPTTVTTSDGFTLRVEGCQSFPQYPTGTGTYCDYQYTDANGIVWYPGSGAYAWPSVGYATNINNGGTLVYFEDRQGDSDNNFTQAERAEQDSTSKIAPGQSASFFEQFKFDQYQAQTGDWCYTGQVHYDNNSGNNAPDIFAIDCTNGNLSIVYQKGSATTVCGTSTTLTQGTTYALQVELTWSSSHSADVLQFWLGTNGTSLTQKGNCSGSLFATDTGADFKTGIYRGYPASNPGTLKLRDMNMHWSNTAGAYSSYRTTQPALPTHP